MPAASTFSKPASGGMSGSSSSLSSVCFGPILTAASTLSAICTLLVIQLFRGVVRRAPAGGHSEPCSTGACPPPIIVCHPAHLSAQPERGARPRATPSQTSRPAGHSEPCSTGACPPPVIVRHPAHLSPQPRRGARPALHPRGRAGRRGHLQPVGEAHGAADAVGGAVQRLVLDHPTRLAGHSRDDGPVPDFRAAAGEVVGRHALHIRQVVVLDRL